MCTAFLPACAVNNNGQKNSFKVAHYAPQTVCVCERREKQSNFWAKKLQHVFFFAGEEWQTQLHLFADFFARDRCAARCRGLGVVNRFFAGLIEILMFVWLQANCFICVLNRCNEYQNRTP